MPADLTLHASPRDRILYHLDGANAAIRDLRTETERARVEQDARLAALVGAEQTTRALTIEAWRARRPRHLLAGETHGPRRALAGGLPAEVAPVDEVTRRSLETMGLAPSRGAESSAERRERLRLLRGILT